MIVMAFQFVAMPEGSVNVVSGAKQANQHSSSLSDMAEMMVAEQERKLLEALRDLKYGEMRVFVENFTIVRLEEKKSIKM